MLNSFRFPAIYLIIFALSTALINTAYARSIDCDKVKAPTEYAICSNPELHDVDVRLNTAYREALGAVGKSSKEGKQLIGSQRAWLKKRNFAWENRKGDCYQNVSCLVEMYEEHIRNIEN
ncbi:MAG: lysozyme inhibitor LprI family protein [Thiotrichaceae bacterium]